MPRAVPLPHWVSRRLLVGDLEVGYPLLVGDLQQTPKAFPPTRFVS